MNEENFTDGTLEEHSETADAAVADIDPDVEAGGSFATSVEIPPSVETPEVATVRLDDIGGIDTAEITLTRGVTVLAGHNTTNRTSLLRGLCAVLGADESTPPARTLSSDATSGEVELDIGGETYTRTYERTDGGAVRVGGDPYVDPDSADVVDTFVALLEDNPARSVIERGGDAGKLRDVLMKPVDTDAIDAEITSLKRRRGRIDDRLDDIESERRRLPTLEQRRQDLEAELEDIEGEIADVEAEVEAYDADESEAQRAEELLEELQEIRGDRSDVEDRIDYHHEQVEEYRDELEAVTEELGGMEVPKDELERIDDEIGNLRRRKRRVEDTINDLDAVINLNEDLVDETGPTGTAPDGHATENLTTALGPEGGSIECWTCGTEVERSTVEDRTDTLRDLRDEKRSEGRRIDADIADLRDEKEALEAKRSDYDDLRSRADTLRAQIEHHESEIESLEDEERRLRDEVADLEACIEETEELRESDLVGAYQRRSELEYERGRLEQELDDVDEEIERIEGLESERDDLEAARGEVTAALSTLRNRVDETERALVEAFNTHMETFVERLNYGNLARVWLEHKPGDAAAAPGTFDLHVVREGESGVYEDSVDTLSESEREVVGLVVALTGYVVHRVYETVPFVVLDSLEAIDGSRIATVLEYFGVHAGFLVAALLPGDAEVVQEREPDADEPPLTVVGPEGFDDS